MQEHTHHLLAHLQMILIAIRLAISDFNLVLFEQWQS